MPPLRMGPARYLSVTGQILLLAWLGIEPRVSYMLSKCSAVGLHQSLHEAPTCDGPRRSAHS